MLFLLLAILPMALRPVSAQTTYTIPYGKGIDTIYAKTGDIIGSDNFVFYEDGDHLTRGDAINGVIPFSSHGYKFWLKNVKMGEDTSGFIVIRSALVMDEPVSLVAMNTRDDRTGGDMYEPGVLAQATESMQKATDSEGFPLWPIPLSAGIILLVIFVVVYRRKWF